MYILSHTELAKFRGGKLDVNIASPPPRIKDTNMTLTLEQ